VRCSHGTQTRRKMCGVGWLLHKDGTGTRRRVHGVERYLLCRAQPERCAVGYCPLIQWLHVRACVCRTVLHCLMLRLSVLVCPV